MAKQWPPFKQGDRVYHVGMEAAGTVSSTAGGFVEVIYDKRSEKTGKNWRGKYDVDWFRIHDDMLRPYAR